MPRLLLVCLILACTLSVQAMGDVAVYPPKLKARALLQSREKVDSIADPPASSKGPEESTLSTEKEEENDHEKESSVAEAPEGRNLGKHHSSDKSVAGGGVIIGGLVTAIFAAVYCYIRVTRRRDADRV